MQWILELIDPIPILGTRVLKDAQALPKKILKHSAEKGAVSPAINKATYPETARTKPPKLRIRARLRHALLKPNPLTVKTKLNLRPLRKKLELSSDWEGP